MRLAELTLWLDKAVNPSLLISKGRLLSSNRSARLLLGPESSTSIHTIYTFEQALPGLTQGIGPRADSWPLNSSIAGQHYQVLASRFFDDRNTGDELVLLELVPLAWAGAPVGFNAGWLHQVSETPADHAVLMDLEGARLSAPARVFQAFGLDEYAGVEDWWDLVRPTDLAKLRDCIDKMLQERWRISEVLDFYTRGEPGSDWSHWHMQLQRLPAMRDKKSWLVMLLTSIDGGVSSAEPDRTKALSGKVGAGSLVVVQLIGLRDFIEANDGDLGRALSSQFYSQVTASTTERDRVWKLSDDSVAVWFGGDTRGRRSDEFWQSLNTLLERPLVFRDTQHRARIRAGRARAVNPESRAEQLTERALAGLADAKIGSIMQATAQTDRSNEANKAQRKRHSQLLSDFDEGRYRMIYQPISHPNDPSDPVGVESLSRSVSANGELFSGGEIVQAAQRHDFVREWTQWGLEQLQTDLSDWLLERPDRFVTFNVMPSLLREASSVDWLIARLRELPDSFRQRLNLEITEQAIGNLIARDSLVTLRDMGVDLYLDDFGAGDSNLYRLIDIQPEAIKLDKFLIDLIMDDQPKLEVLSQVLSLARTISPRIIAEGIETEAQFNMVRNLDVDLIQGYYIGRRLDLETGEPLGSSLPSS